MFYVSKKSKLQKTPTFGQEGVATKQFLITCVLQNVRSYGFVGPCLGESYRFWPTLGQILVAVQKKHSKNRYFCTLKKTKKPKKAKKYHFEGLLSGPLGL